MLRSALAIARGVVRVSYSQILRLHRCPWAWHAQRVRGLVPLAPRRPAPLWGTAYHAAAAVVWDRRARAERWGVDYHGPWQDPEVEARRSIEDDAPPGFDVDTVARDAATAAAEVCAWVGPEWRVLWLGDEPAVELRLLTPLSGAWAPLRGEVEATAVACELETVLDLVLVHAEDGRMRVVDHKTTSSWPENPGDALPGEDLHGVDLRDDLQLRLYAAAMRHALGVAAEIEGAHLVRRAAVGEEPRLLARGSLSRAQSVTATPEQWRRAIRRHHLREEDYEPEIARAALVRWQAWAPVEWTERTLEGARRIALEACSDVARWRDLPSEEVPRRPQPGRWRPGASWGGLAPSAAEAFQMSGCAACDHRDLCVAEERGDEDAAALIQLAHFRSRRAAEPDPDAAEADATAVEEPA